MTDVLSLKPFATEPSGHQHSFLLKISLPSLQPRQTASLPRSSSGCERLFTLLPVPFFNQIMAKLWQNIPNICLHYQVIFAQSLPCWYMTDILALEPLALQPSGHQHSLLLKISLPSLHPQQMASLPLSSSECEWLFTLLPYSGNGTFPYGGGGNRYNADIISLSEYGRGFLGGE